jgi:hypothetical protein
MFKDCSDMNASGSHFSNIVRDQHVTVGGDLYNQTIVNFQVPTDATTTLKEQMQDSAESQLQNTVRLNSFSRAPYLASLYRLLTTLQSKQIGELSSPDTC